MADLQNYSFTVGNNAAVVVQRYVIEAEVRDSSTNALIADFTGANALEFPNVLGTLTQQQRDALMQLISKWLLFTKAGV